MSFRCPWCGSPVTVRGHRWECGWCGDFGDLSSLPSARRAAADWKHKERAEQINQALLPLEQGAFSILEGMRVYCGGEEGAREPLWKLTAYRDFQRAALRCKAGSGAAGAAPRVFCKVSNSGRREASGHCPGWYGGLCSGVRTLKRTAGHLLAGASAPDPRRRLRPCLA